MPTQKITRNHSEPKHLPSSSVEIRTPGELPTPMPTDKIGMSQGVLGPTPDPMSSDMYPVTVGFPKNAPPGLYQIGLTARWTGRTWILEERTIAECKVPEIGKVDPSLWRAVINYRANKYDLIGLSIAGMLAVLIFLNWRRNRIHNYRKFLESEGHTVYKRHEGDSEK